MSRARSFWLVFIAFIPLVLMPVQAYAAYEQLWCNGPAVGGGTLYYANIDTAEGNCQYQGINHVFSQVICNFVTVLNKVLDQFYCGMQYALKNTLAILLTIYVTVFGVQLLLGTAQLNSKDVIVRLLKISAVWTFATEASWGVGFVFNFFMSVINEGSSWVVNPIRNIATVDLSIIGQSPDTPAANIIPAMNDGDVMPLFGFLDRLVYGAFAGPLSSGNTKIMGFFVAVGLIYTPLSALALWWLWTTFITLVRTMMSFMMCLAAIAFLVALSPIFLSLMLFQATNHFFENWLRYMISYSLQVILVFAIIVLWVVVVSKFIAFFADLADLIFPVSPIMVPGPLYDPLNSWGICPPIYGEALDGSPTAVCPEGFDPDSATDPDSWLFYQQALILPSNIAKETKLIYYICYHFLSLGIVFPGCKKPNVQRDSKKY